MTSSSKKVFIKTYGCQMNVYDSQRMDDALQAVGYCATQEPDDADLIILNTCHIREKAAEKVYSEIGRLRRLKQTRAAAGGRLTIAVAGCVAQAEGEEIVRRAPAVDLVFGPQVYHHLPEMLERALKGEIVVATEFPSESKFDALPQPDRKAIAARGAQAFVSVQEGCDKFCTFCVVPYTRGAEFSRPVDDIVAEAARLAEAGVMELTLLGQNVNAYHGRNARGHSVSLAELLHRLAHVPGILRLRYTTSHPRDMSDDLIAAHGELDCLMPYLHLPIQSGSDRILAAMNRRHDAAFYLDIIDRLMKVRPDMALSGDFIVGFPGETDRDFEDTLALVQSVGYAQAYSFKYSPRPGTPAANMDAQVPEAVKAERLARLQAAINAGQHQFNRAVVGRTMDVLLDRPGRQPGQLAGRSPYLQAVHVSAPDDLRGTLQQVAIVAAGPNSLSGVVAGLPAGGKVLLEGAAT